MPSISARWASLTSTYWSSSMRADAAKAIYPEWRGGYYFAGKPKATNRRRSECSMFRAGRARRKRRSSRPCMRNRWPSAIRSTKALGADGKVADDAPPAIPGERLRGRHAWLTEEGVGADRSPGRRDADQRKSGRRDTVSGWKPTSGRRKNRKTKPRPPSREFRLV
jgi:hypothetical protein